MKIAIISEWFSEKMGYAENYLPENIGKLGYEVHLVTSNLQVYGTYLELYNEVYRKHLGPHITETGVFKKEFYTLHRNNFSIEGGLHVADLEQKFNEIKPDIVYCFEIMTRDYLNVIELKKKFKYKIFCESRMHLSVFQKPKGFVGLKNQFKIKKNSVKLSKEVDVFYPIAKDVYQVITKYYGIPKKKCKLSSLAVDISKFYKFENKDKNYKASLGFKDDDIICIYTGRFTKDKGTVLLAKAINYLTNQGIENIKALFVGNGDNEIVNEIRSMKNCFIHPFVESELLLKLYNVSDIGVWPCQESTSQLDAMACGLPLIISDKVDDKFRIENCGFSYRENDFIDLSQKISALKSQFDRIKLGNISSKKIIENYSWEKLAKDKIVDFSK
ncbi:MAG: glycosyltransferase family 4 protein [Flavobacteriia bacterium]|nr:glycosyltransferase family 4 protein [Flavobacteriia bacterium]